MTELHWLPTLPDWRQRLKTVPEDPAAAWDTASGYLYAAKCREDATGPNTYKLTSRQVLGHRRPSVNRVGLRIRHNQSFFAIAGRQTG